MTMLDRLLSIQSSDDEQECDHDWEQESRELLEEEYAVRHLYPRVEDGDIHLEGRVRSRVEERCTKCDDTRTRTPNDVPVEIPIEITDDEL